MQDNANMDKKQAEALSAAIDALNRDVLPEDCRDGELEELILTATLVKNAGQVPDLPPQAVLDHIVNQAANTIAREKRKKRLTWGFASLSGAAAAVLLVALLNIFPPVSPERELAKAPQTEPAPAAEIPQPATIAPTPPNLTSPQGTKADTLPPATSQPPAAAPEATETAPPVPDQPHVALVPPKSPVPAASDTMLALADRKADVVTIDAATKIIRQIYRQGGPDEIIVTQAPKQQSITRSAPTPPKAMMRMAAAVSNESADIKPPNKNKVKVTVNNTEVTLEGAATEEELLNLAKTLTEVSVAK